jgi:GGDEF domain-containing protein
MSEGELRVFYVGSNDLVRDQLSKALKVECQSGLPTEGTRGVVVFLDSDSGSSSSAELLGGNAFTACRDLKDRLGVQVYLLVGAEDRITAEIGRFCLADGSLEVGPEGLVEEVGFLSNRVVPHRARVSVDDLLEKLEQQISSDEGRQASAIQRMLSEGVESSLMDHLVDPETGLFDGPYASFKIDEEFKRSRRFHQPLSLLLLDVGVDLESSFADANARQAFLAEIASVFLNQCRDIDVISRFTVSTFMILLPGTGSAGADVVAGRMMAELEAKGLYEGLQGRPHSGLATMPATGIPDRSAFLARAEARLQMSKTSVVS